MITHIHGMRLRFWYVIKTFILTCQNKQFEMCFLFLFRHMLECDYHWMYNWCINKRAKRYYVKGIFRICSHYSDGKLEAACTTQGLANQCTFLYTFFYSPQRKKIKKHLITVRTHSPFLYHKLQLFKCKYEERYAKKLLWPRKKIMCNDVIINDRVKFVLRL